MFCGIAIANPLFITHVSCRELAENCNLILFGLEWGSKQTCKKKEEELDFIVAATAREP